MKDHCDRVSAVLRAAATGERTLLGVVGACKRQLPASLHDGGVWTRWGNPDWKPGDPNDHVQVCAECAAAALFAPRDPDATVPPREGPP